MKSVERECRRSPQIKALRVFVLIFIFSLANALVAARGSQDLSIYRSPLEFSLNYPSAWKYIDILNVDNYKKELAAQQDKLPSEYYRDWENAIKRVETQKSKVVFYDPSQQDEFVDIDLLLVPKKQKIALTSEPVLQEHLPKPNLPENAKLIRKTPLIRESGKSKILLMEQEYAVGTGSTRHIANSVLINGDERSFIICCDAPATKISKPGAVMNLMTASFQERRQLNQGLLKMPAWLELVIIAIFATMIVVLVRKTIVEYSPHVKSKYEHSRKLTTLGFIGLVVAVWLILVGATWLFKL